MFKYVLILLVVFSINLFAQSSKKISPDRYNFLVDSLTTKKSVLLLEKESLLSEIDSLNNLLVELEERFTSARSKQLTRKYGKIAGKRIARGQVWKGMTEIMLKDSWGRPDKVTKNKEKWGVFTQWYYGDITYFFRDGKMTDWEENK